MCLLFHNVPKVQKEPKKAADCFILLIYDGGNIEYGLLSKIKGFTRRQRLHSD